MVILNTVLIFRRLTLRIRIRIGRPIQLIRSSTVADTLITLIILLGMHRISRSPYPSTRNPSATIKAKRITLCTRGLLPVQDLTAMLDITMALEP